MVISISIIIARKKVLKNGEYLATNLIQVLYICYSDTLEEKSILILFNLQIEINVIYSIFIKKLDFLISLINIKAQKINSTTLNIYVIVLVAFLVTN